MKGGERLPPLSKPQGTHLPSRGGVRGGVSFSSIKEVGSPLGGVWVGSPSFPLRVGVSSGGVEGGVSFFPFPFYITKLQTPPLAPPLEGRGVATAVKQAVGRFSPIKGRVQGWGLYLLLFMFAFAMTNNLLQRYKK